MVSFNPAITGQGRTFVNTEGSGCGNSFEYLGCYKIDSLEQSLGEVTSIYCPSEEQYNSFVEIASIKGADSRWTSSLVGTLPVDSQSVLEIIRRRGCSFNLQVHFGTCNRPDDFSQFDSAIVLQDVRLTNYSLSSLTALSPDERAAVSETASISVGSVYRVFPLEYSFVANTVATLGAIVGITICDSVRCGTECSSIGSSDGCQRIFALNIIEGVVPSFVFSTDGGITWTQRDTNLPVSPALTNVNFNDHAILCLGTEIWASVHNGLNGVTSVIETDGIEFTNNDFTATVITDVEGVIRDLDVGSNNVYAVGEGDNNSYIVAINKSTKVVTEIDDGGLSNLISFISVDAIDDNVVLVGAQNGFIAFSSVEGSFVLEQVVIDGANLLTDVTDVHLIDDTNWLIESGGTIYCTSNRGITWKTVLTSTSSGKFSFYDNILGYFQNNDNIYTTMDGGNSWNIIATTNGVAPGSVEVCSNDPNVFYSGGGNLDADTPFIIKGVVT